ncbi:hypothetical protein [Flavobacterium alkalisoli]|uniref:hypothetical protein n=1 Tax=Flavobacterium alkalisoli TaxID=2602769 RepID=UPI003A949AED
MKRLYLVLPVFLLFIACSDENTKEAKTAINSMNVHVVHDDDPPTGQGDIPRSKLVYKSFDQNSFTLAELCDRYKSDIEVTAPDYHDNLKNFWFSIMGDRVISEGSDEVKKYFIEEQLSLQNNLMNLERFYKLLLASPLSEEESLVASNTFYEINEKAIAGLQWKSEKEEMAKRRELVYTKRTYEILIRSSK